MRRQRPEPLQPLRPVPLPEPQVQPFDRLLQVPISLPVPVRLRRQRHRRTPRPTALLQAAALRIGFSRFSPLFHSRTSPPQSVQRRRGLRPCLSPVCAEFPARPTLSAPAAYSELLLCARAATVRLRALRDGGLEQLDGLHGVLVEVLVRDIDRRLAGLRFELGVGA